MKVARDIHRSERSDGRQRGCAEDSSNTPDQRQDAMTRPRKTLVSLVDTPYRRGVSRCVRGVFLCAFDQSTPRSFERRRGWIARPCKTCRERLAGPGWFVRCLSGPIARRHRGDAGDIRVHFGPGTHSRMHRRHRDRFIRPRGRRVCEPPRDGRL